MLKLLAGQWEEPVVSHYRHDPFTTLISCILSLRTKDETTHRAARKLFELADNPEKMVQLSTQTIERAIFPVGFYHTKAKVILKICRILLDRYDGRVPEKLDGLLELPGVGRKTANLVVTLAFHKPGICVDTHVHRISNRWGYVRTKNPDETEMVLRRILPKRHWITYNDLLVPFGQNLCHPTSPWCSQCPIERLCPKVGLKHSR